MNILNTRPLLERLVFCVCLSLVARICALPRVSTAMTWLVLNAAVLTGLLGCVAYMLAAYPVENKKDDANEKEVAIPLVVAVEAPSANSVKDAKDSSNIVSAENTQEYSIRALSLNPPSLVDDNLHDCDHTLVDSDSLLTPSATRQDVFTKLVLDEFFFQNSHASSEKDAIFPLIDSKPTNPPPVAFVKPESPINPISVFIKPPAMYELVGGDTQSFSSLSTITTDSIFSEVADLGDLFDKSESSFELTPFSVESSAPVVTTMPNRWESQSLPSYQFAAGIQPVQPANRKTVSFAETEKRDSAINIIDDPPIPAINNISMFSSRLSRDLTVLKLSKMGLESFPVTLYQLKGLQEIDLCNNKISRLDPQFGKFTDLTVCDLSWNALGSIGISILT